MTDPNDERDELTGIFDHIRPEDFILETTAIQEYERTNEGVEAFNAFVDEQLRAARQSWIAAEGEVQPIAILASTTKQRVFTPDDEETLGEWVQRLHREAQRMQANWVFLTKRTMVGSAAPGAQDVDFNDQEAVQAAIEAGTLVDGSLWYAERREGGERHHRFGIMRAKNGRLAEMEEGPSSQPSGLWSLILA